MQQIKARTIGPVIPISRPHSSSTNASPSFQSAYAKLVKEGGTVLEGKVKRLNIYIKFSPAIIAVIMYFAIIISGYASNALEKSVFGVFLVLAGLVMVLGLHTYSTVIDDYVRSKILTPESRITASLCNFVNPGDLPAGSLQLPYLAIMKIIRPYVNSQGFNESDIDVCFTLLEDGFDGNVDDLLAIARNLR